MKMIDCRMKMVVCRSKFLPQRIGLKTLTWSELFVQNVPGSRGDVNRRSVGTLKRPIAFGDECWKAGRGGGLFSGDLVIPIASSMST